MLGRFLAQSFSHNLIANSFTICTWFFQILCTRGGKYVYTFISQSWSRQKDKICRPWIKPLLSGHQWSNFLVGSKKGLVIKRRAQGIHWSDASFTAAVELVSRCGATVTPTGQSDQKLMLQCIFFKWVGMHTHTHTAICVRLCMFMPSLMRAYACVS